MSEYQITYWQDLPSLVAARDGEDTTKAPLAARFQEAIDSAAMTLGAVDSDAYLAGWRRTEWMAADGAPTEVCDEVVSRLEAQWSQEALSTYLLSLEPDSGPPA
ncbi:MAG: virulence factor [Nocardioidaceae bacterium]